MRRARGLCILVGLALAVPSVFPASAAPAKAGWEDAVQALLDRRAAAALARDPQAFLDTVDPQAPAAFRDAQAKLAAGLASVPFSSYRLVLRTDDVRDLSGGVRDRRGADQVVLPEVSAQARIQGIDDRDATQTLWYTFVRRGSRWYVAADDDLADLGLRTTRALWDAGPVAFRRGTTVTVAYHPEDADRAGAVLDIAEAGDAAVRADVPWPHPPQVLVVLPHSVDELRDILQTTFDLTNFVAFAAAEVDRHAPSGWEWSAPRVYAQDVNLSRHGRQFQLDTFHHELTHVVSFPKAGPFIPNWVHEGMAEWEATGRPGPSRVPGSDGKLPLDYQFTTGGGDSIVRAYRASTSAVAFLAARKGAGAPFRLFETLGSQRVVPGTWRYHTDQALRAVAGMGLDEFERAWRGG